MDCLLYTSGREMVATKEGPLIIIIGGKRCSDAAWEEWCAVAHKIESDFGKSRLVLNHILHGVDPPSAKQRKMLSDHTDLEQFKRSAIITDSALMRGAITAISWIRKTPLQVRAFNQGDSPAALRWLNEDTPFEERNAMLAYRAALEAAGVSRPDIDKLLA